jgi:CBS domain-containing protein
MHDGTARQAAGTDEDSQKKVRKIAVFHVGSLLGERDRLIGIVTDRDIVFRNIVEGKGAGSAGKSWPRTDWVS